MSIETETGSGFGTSAAGCAPWIVTGAGLRTEARTGTTRDDAARTGAWRGLCRVGAVIDDEGTNGDLPARLGELDSSDMVFGGRGDMTSAAVTAEIDEDVVAGDCG